MLVAAGIDPLLMYIYTVVLDAKGLLADNVVDSGAWGCYGA